MGELRALRLAAEVKAGVKREAKVKRSRARKESSELVSWLKSKRNLPA